MMAAVFLHKNISVISNKILQSILHYKVPCDILHPLKQLAISN